ncbi:MAG: hypothetical protein AVDCRST_MAG77-618 [uncultured Chloroflexi bacterium]|uniref:Uncharacterized protein n=1 Tax=uncultured Chloroflexota bacterium TaxID=166587 RepID=A0A6J4HIY4_9CHLR|nr:MAG: hypothetical protein AVDCRST_MAG77-618 [uncultured Chloroflexota bacterium]
MDLAAGRVEDAGIYAGAGCPELLERDVHPGAHAFSGAKAFDWMARHLGHTGGSGLRGRSGPFSPSGICST